MCSVARLLAGFVLLITADETEEDVVRDWTEQDDRIEFISCVQESKRAVDQSIS